MKHSKPNLIIGSTVVFDFPTWTKEVREEFRERATKEVEDKNPRLWMKTGIVVGTNVSDGCVEIDVRMDEDGRIVSANRNQISITALPPKDVTDELLQQILYELNVLTEYIRSR